MKNILTTGLAALAVSACAPGQKMECGDFSTRIVKNTKGQLSNWLKANEIHRESFDAKVCRAAAQQRADRVDVVLNVHNFGELETGMEVEKTFATSKIQNSIFKARANCVTETMPDITLDLDGNIKVGTKTETNCDYFSDYGKANADILTFSEEELQKAYRLTPLGDLE